MSIVRGFWRVLVGVKDFLVLLLMVLIFAVIFAAVNREEAAPQIAEGGALTIPLDGYLVTQAQPIDPFQLLSGAPIVGEIETSRLIAVIEEAAEDERVASIVLDLDGFFGGGLSDLQDVGDALVEFRATGKDVVTYASAYLDAGWLLAAHADEIWVSPMGAVVVGGPGGSQLYFAEALDKLNVNVNVFRVGTYKSAVEPYIQNEASEAARRARAELIEDLWGAYLLDAKAARPNADLDAYIDDVPAAVRVAGGDFSQAALALGLVDRVGTRTEFGLAMAERVGALDEDPAQYLSTDFGEYAANGAEPVFGGDAVGIITVAGTIVDGEAPAGTAGGETIANLVKSAVADGDIKALVVRIDSPGGSAFASEQIRQALLSAKVEGLPVVASFGPVAASGGYWVSTGADVVVAQPTSITGSIGVFSVVPTFERTLAELGINVDGVQATPLSGAPDILGGLSEPTEQLLQLSVEDIYRRFIALVSESRGLTPERVDEIAQGRVWSGGAARQLGLVDRFGSLDDAVAIAEEAAGFEVGELRRVFVREPQPFPIALIEEFMQAGAPAAEGPVDLALAVRRAELGGAISAAAEVATGPAVQVRCLACTSHRSPRSKIELPGWLQAVRGWFE